MNYYVGMNSTIKCDVGGEPIPVVTWEGENGTSLDDNMVVSVVDNIVHVNVACCHFFFEVVLLILILMKKYRN